MADRIDELAETFGWTSVGVDRSLVTLGPAPQAAAVTLPDRYEDLALIGQGGQGVVRLVCDHKLGRLAAIKLLSRADSDTARALFLAESATTAALEHPGIVPVYDRGTTADGQPWYAMRYVRGRTLAEAVGGEDALPLRRRVDALLRAAEAVAYAHHEGVVHLDLKPQNILLGPFGEVLVTDWGLAQRIGPMAEALRGSGTPAYMPPEQAEGLTTVRPSADVFALGSCLWHMLAGQPPGRSPAGDGPLWALVRQARAADPAERLADGAAFAQRLRRWLDGEARRDAAAERVARAQALAPEVQRLEAEADGLAEEAAAILAPLPGYAPVDDRRPAWRLADRADRLRQQAHRLSVERVTLLRQALELAPDAQAARDALIAHHRRALLAAEGTGDEPTVATHAAELNALDRAGQAKWLRGDGRLLLHTAQPATAWLAALLPHDRRLVATPLGCLGPTPIDVALPMGRYQVVLRAPGRAAVIYPVHITRGHVWDGVAPGESEPTPIPLPRPLDDNECYVPPGWCVVGGDRQAVDALPRRRVWVDGFVLSRRPVTNAEYLAWLNTLVANGQAAEAAEHVPNGPRAPAYAMGPDGRYQAPGVVLGSPWPLDAPVVRITPASAMAYAAFRAQRDGLPWRLPHSLEWEKAARGVDGRSFPMGDTLIPPWANVAQSGRGAPSLRPVEDHPLDRSPYGVLGLAGNVRDTCHTRYQREGQVPDGERLRPMAHRGQGTLWVVRGGSLISPPIYCRAAGRFAVTPGERSSAGLRLARSWPVSG